MYQRHEWHGTEYMHRTSIFLKLDNTTTDDLPLKSLYRKITSSNLLLCTVLDTIHFIAGHRTRYRICSTSTNWMEVSQGISAIQNAFNGLVP